MIVLIELNSICLKQGLKIQVNHIVDNKVIIKNFLVVFLAEKVKCWLMKMNEKYQNKYMSCVVLALGFFWSVWSEYEKNYIIAIFNFQSGYC